MSNTISASGTLAQRWVNGVNLHAVKVLHSGGNHAEVARALATLTGDIRTLSRRAGRQLNLCVPGWVRDALGWNPGVRVVLKLSEDGVLLVREARSEDLLGFAQPAVEAADQAIQAQQRSPKLKHFECDCESCGVVFCAGSPHARFCRACRLDRRRGQIREYWHRKGKRTPSYRAKLNPHGLLDPSRGHRLPMPRTQTHQNGVRDASPPRKPASFTGQHNKTPGERGALGLGATI
jgi:bifunctional DNA-binding transcriptional regulator/antitoxin component of YhaV-PrlF toxin-antitoxin module